MDNDKFPLNRKAWNEPSVLARASRFFGKEMQGKSCDLIPICKMSPAGLEPTTHGLKVRCSTN